MTTEMQARIMFDTPEDMAVGKAELIRRGFRVETLDTVDPEGGPYVWVRAYVTSITPIRSAFLIG